MNSSAIHRSLKETYALGFSRLGPQRSDTIPTGIQAIDQLTGGLPQGRITEICGPDSSGRTTLLLSAMAQITEKRFCGLIDPAGIFDPVSADATGIDLNRLLWIRTGRNIDSILKALDLLLQGGGFGLVGVDLGEIPLTHIRRVPLSSWFRLQRVVEHTPTILLFINREPLIQTCTALTLTLKPERVNWSGGLLRGIQPRAKIIRSKTNPIACRPGHSSLFDLQSANCLRAVPKSGVSFFSNETNTEGVSYL